MPAQSLSLRLPGHLEELPHLYDTVEQFGHAHAFEEMALNHIQLALEEIVSNVIRHGYADSGEHVIEISLVVEGDSLVVEVCDDGVAFDPLSRPEINLDVPLEERPVGGLGIHLVKTMMDEVSYTRKGDVNVLRFRKCVHPAG